MAYQALYRKYRPTTFSDVIGQEHITETLKNEIADKKTVHAYLFTGTRGTGKTTCAKIFAKAINCQNSNNGEPCLECNSCTSITDGENTDIVEIDAASNNGVDNIRELRDLVGFTPSTSKYRVFIIDEVHMLSAGAFNALLKTLEEPPEHVVFILATTEVHKLPATILSRCQRFDFRGVGNKEIVERINFIAKEENIEISKEAVELIAECAEGGMRDALSLLDEAISYAGNKVDVSSVYQVSGAVDLDNILSLAGAILEKDSAKVLNALETIVDLGKEIPKICNDLISFYRDLLLYKNNHKNGKSLYTNTEFMILAKKLSNQKVYFYLNVLNEAQYNMKSTNQKRTYLELALIKMSDFVEQISVDNLSLIEELGNKIKDLENKIKELELSPRRVVETPSVKEEVKVVRERNNEFHYIETKMIEEVLNNGNRNKKNLLINKLSEVKNLKKEKVIVNTLQDANIVAASGEVAIITLPQLSLCDFMMQRENKNKVLGLFNSPEKLISNYYAIPESIWEIMLKDYTAQFKAGTKKPTLTEVCIDVRLYDEVSESQESEMQKVAKEIFGDNVDFE